MIAGRMGGPATFRYAAFGGEATTDPDGSFRLAGVIPGDHWLRVIHPSRGEWVRGVTLDHDTAPLNLVVPAPTRVEGRIVHDGAGPLPFDASEVNLNITSVPDDQSNPSALRRRLSDVGTVRADDTFVLDEVFVPARITVTRLPRPWSMATVQVNGADVTFDSSHVRRGGDQVEIVVTDTPAAIAGLVTDARGRPVAHGWVVVFPADAQIVGRPRVVHSARLRQDGRFSIEPVAPANYLAIAVSIPRNGWSDPSLTEQWWAKATPFRVAPSERQILQLELLPAPPG